MVLRWRIPAGGGGCDRARQRRRGGLRSPCGVDTRACGSGAG